MTRLDYVDWQRRLNSARRGGFSTGQGRRHSPEALRWIAADRRAADLLGVSQGSNPRRAERALRADIAARLTSPPPPPGHVYVAFMCDMPAEQALALAGAVLITINATAWERLEP